jgi:hypothetical protein
VAWSCSRASRASARPPSELWQEADRMRLLQQLDLLA